MPVPNMLPPLRCATAGSVDDGKSTLIGRLLLDAKALYTDQLAHLDDVRHRRGLAERDLALVTDGLRAEREQGITIDVAWRYYATATRRFILAAAPGHVQYTRNMVTAASHADVAIILVDARRGMTEQSRRHLFVARLLGVRGLTFAINKMDQVDFASAAFADIRGSVTDYLSSIDLPRAAAELAFIPLSALHGDNVVGRSSRTPWYEGPSLLEHLERAPVDADRSDAPSRFPVQCVLRAGGGVSADGRGYAGRVASGTFRAGDTVRVLPADAPATILSIETADGVIDEARAGASVVLKLTTELDVGRGDLIVGALDKLPRVDTDLTADLAWVHKTESRLGAPYLVKVGTREVRASLEAVLSAYDVASGVAGDTDGRSLSLNDLARVRLRAREPVAIDAYADARTTGSFLLLDATSGDTLAAGMAR